MNRKDVEENLEIIKNTDKLMIKVWESGRELTDKNEQVWRCNIVKNPESEDKMAYEMMEIFLLLPVALLEVARWDL